jgi:hypothetical protein
MGPETIRNRALECLWLAQNESDPEQKSLLLTMAHSWADLANSVEKLQSLVGKNLSIPRSSPIIVRLQGLAESTPQPTSRSRLH